MRETISAKGQKQTGKLPSLVAELLLLLGRDRLAALHGRLEHIRSRRAVSALA